ncbi:dihydropteroate synthase [Hydrocarboniphaga sp.]|uniref:dihydropteroate synthase n=1 Tax=Hydrocarboniphaga sp. TaxID=2033016 RepID=UPI0026105FA1|nr:dihydropteroate synthase [Hydrocarboniphaga sp.]
MQLRTRDRLLDLSEPLVMGILNLTPDSFSDGGRYAARDAALRRVETMIGEGAVIIDVGGESTRPGARPVSVAEELDRVVPLIEALRAGSDILISIDTLKPDVMDASCAAGADLINDVLALQAPGALAVAERHRVAVCLMHMQGEPRTMQAAPHYDDVVIEVGAFLNQRLQACIDAGIDAECVVLDPGFGFGKTLQHNLELLADLPRMRVGGRPVLAGLSRKSMFQKLLGLPVDQRLHASLAAAALAVWQGASIIRAHDVRATVEAVRVAAAVLRARK